MPNLKVWKAATQTWVQVGAVGTVSPGGGSTTYELRLSTVAGARDPSIALAGATVSGNIIVTLVPETNVTRVDFWIDDPNRIATPRWSEEVGPFDFNGQTGTVPTPFDTSRITNGTHSITAAVSLSDNRVEVTTASFTIANAVGYTLYRSADATFLSRAVLSGSTVSGTIHVGVFPSTDISQVVFKRDGTTIATDTTDPFATSINTTLIADGLHTVTAEITDVDSVLTTLNAEFTVENAASAIATYMGWFYTEEEVAIWRQRAANGPYKTRGDVKANSPGDWDRIVANKSQFMASPTSGIVNLTSSLAVHSADSAASSANADQAAGRARDAAFFGLVMNDIAVRNAAKTWCMNQLAQVNAPAWGTVTGGTDPMHSFGQWWLEMMYLIGCLQPYFTASELATVDLKVYQVARVCRQSANSGDSARPGVDTKWGNRYTAATLEDYILTGTSAVWRVAYDGGPDIYDVQRRYNNRAGAVMAALGTSVAYLRRRSYTGTDMTVLERDTRKFVQEFIHFITWPQGVIGDFERGYDGNRPSQGWEYSGDMLGFMVIVADAWGRIGDLTLIDYETVDGIHGGTGSHTGGTAGAPSYTFGGTFTAKCLEATAVALAGYLNRDFNRNVSGGRITSAVYVQDMFSVMGNLRWKNTYYKTTYKRAGSFEAAAYPASPLGGPGSAFSPYSGAGGGAPGLAFMYFDMEDLVDIYA